jgi:dTDP-4-dehydrorhamnose 3,5-epimerase
MHFTETEISGVWIHNPVRVPDARGTFEEQFKASAIRSELGRDFQVLQVNQSVSNKGVVRGIHWTAGSVGQAKYLSCVRGSIWDVYVDLRLDSKTFGQWGSEFISLENGKSVVISEGIGHAFLTLEEGTVVNYLCTSEYEPSADMTINPLDPDLAIPFLQTANDQGIPDLTLSDRDRNGIAFSAIQEEAWGPKEK